jgi:hypothetical protein
MMMRLSSGFIAPLAVVVLSTSLLSGTAVSQTATGSSTIPTVTVDAPKQLARPHRPGQAASNGASRRIIRAAQESAQVPAPKPSAAPNSTLARLAEIERTSSNCTDGCQTSFKYGNQPWNGCSTTGDLFSPTCRNVRNFKTYEECTEHGLFIGWSRSAVWWYCSSLAAGNKFKVAELKRAGR